MNITRTRRTNNYDGTASIDRIDRIIGYCDGYAIYTSDIYPYENYIGYETEDGKIVYTNQKQ